MSKQWGHGFHKGHKDGISDGLDIGQSVGLISVGEHAWHSVNTAIDLIEKGDDVSGLMLLRTLLFALASATGRDVPPFNRMLEVGKKDCATA
jgi:hypothetical protein